MRIFHPQKAGAGLAAFIAEPLCRHSSPRAFAHQQSRRITSTRGWRQQGIAPVPETPPPPQASANAQRVQHELSPSDESEPLRSLTDSLANPPPVVGEDEKQVDWTRSFHGLSSTPFTPEQANTLQQPLEYDDIEIKPDGIVYLPEIKYRRILNKVFGPGGWGLAPRGETIVTAKIVTREYGLVCGGRLVSIARGEMQYFDPDGIPTATEGCKSNALMRCCKDLGIASELWDPRFIKTFLAKMGKEIMVEHQTTKRRRKHFMRKDDELKWPLKEVPVPGAQAVQAPASRNADGVTKQAGVAAKKAFGTATASSRAVSQADPSTATKS